MGLAIRFIISIRASGSCVVCSVSLLSILLLSEWRCVAEDPSYCSSHVTLSDSHGVTRVSPVHDGASPEAGWRLNEWYPRTTSVPRIPQALAGVRYQPLLFVLSFRKAAFLYSLWLVNTGDSRERRQLSTIAQATVTRVLYIVKTQKSDLCSKKG